MSMMHRAAGFPRSILDDPEFGEPLIACCNAEPVQRVAGGDVNAGKYLCEAAGRAFTGKYEAKHQSAAREDAGTNDSDDTSDEDEEGQGCGRGSKEKAAGGMLRMSDLLKGVNLYELMGVSEGASQDEVKKAYRSLALTAHPDKLASVGEEEAKVVQERFVKIQEAYELLSDPTKRMQYDSMLDFDDSLPRFKAGDEDFFEVFAEAFKRNARFSVRRPVPDIGGPDSKPEEWKKFYNFWHEFQSWRDPLSLAQKDGEELCDLAEAECREEKRWMMRENNRIAKKYKQAERDRLAELVRLAEKHDPRVAAEKEAKKIARQAAAAQREEEKLAAKRAKEEVERKRQQEEEAARQIELEKRKAEKAVKEAQKAEIKKCRQRLRALHPAVKDFVKLEQLNEVCLQLQEADLRKLGNDTEVALKKDVATAVGILHKAIESIGLRPITPLKKEEDTASTSSGPSQTSHEEDTRTPQERQQEEQAMAARRKAAEKKRKEEEARLAEERAIAAAQRAEEKKKMEEKKRQEQQQADIKRRQQEKKAEEKARKAEEKQKKTSELEAQKREQQREEAKQRSKEQAEKDRAEALAKQQELEAERVARIFEMDRRERLDKLDPMTDEDLASQLHAALDDDASLQAAFSVMKKKSEAGSELALDRAMTLVYKIHPVWALGLAPPADLKLPSNIRSRVKKARCRLRDTMTKVLSIVKFADASESLATEWQCGIADGTIEPPTWTVEEREAEEEAERIAKQAEAQATENAASAAKKGKKAKAAKEPKGDENLDDLLAEFGCTPAPQAKKANKKKK